MKGFSWGRSQEAIWIQLIACDSKLRDKKFSSWFSRTWRERGWIYSLNLGRALYWKRIQTCWKFEFFINTDLLVKSYFDELMEITYVPNEPSTYAAHHWQRMQRLTTDDNRRSGRHEIRGAAQLSVQSVREVHQEIRYCSEKRCRRTDTGWTSMSTPLEKLEKSTNGVTTWADSCLTVCRADRNLAQELDRRLDGDHILFMKRCI